ncbi:MAG: hypothetical protein GY832_02465 [Chloroflexi bacterium]|nr:hypothetical protein [Chloroflexota bacterium]
MKKGLLWCDASKLDMTEKVRQAVRRYKQKFGAVPKVCYVHPSALESNGKLTKVDGVRVTSRPSVLRHHFWVGQEDIKGDNV